MDGEGSDGVNGRDAAVAAGRAEAPGGVEVYGEAAEGWQPVRAAFADNFSRRGDLGAAVALYHRGRKVVDLWAGGADFDGTRPWRRDTAQTVRSAGKGAAAACLLLLHQRGQLDLDAPVGTYWPEFKARGKDRVTVRDVLAHRAGVPALDTPLTPGQALDGGSGPRAVAAQAPLFPPGEEHGYHAQTYSWLLGELVLRASGRTIGQYVADEIARPLGLDLWLGLPAGQAHRVGRIGEVVTPDPPASGGLRARPKRAVDDAYADPGSLTRRAFGAIAPPPEENDPAYRAGELAGSNTIATARSLARCYAAMIGDVEGAGRLFVPATVTAARTTESDGPDRVLVVHTRFGLGYMLHGPASPLLGPGSFGHPGRGGTLAFADPDHGVGFGYVTNGLQKSVTADPRAQALVRAVRQCLR
jgi:CubicO group peptidase (beta-lactamase class C family)